MGDMLVLGPLAHLTVLAQMTILAHPMTSDVWELLALIGPFGIIFGAGVLLVIGPIIRSQGDRYRHKEVTPDKRTPTNGTHRSPRPSRSAERSARQDGGEVVGARREDSSN
jgi:hypothetical protein